jgi:hypothetical protein
MTPDNANSNGHSVPTRCGLKRSITDTDDAGSSFEIEASYLIADNRTSCPPAERVKSSLMATLKLPRTASPRGDVPEAKESLVVKLQLPAQPASPGPVRAAQLSRLATDPAPTTTPTPTPSSLQVARPAPVSQATRDLYEVPTLADRYVPRTAAASEGIEYYNPSKFSLKPPF